MPLNYYVGLKGRLTQAWLAAPLVILVVFIIKLVILRTVINSVLVTAEKSLLAACNNLQEIYKLVAQAPQETLKLANELVVASVNHSLKGILRSVSMILTVIESLILFALEMNLGTYACLTISTVNIAANEALNATESVVSAANKTASTIGEDINKGLNGLSKLINGAIGLINVVDDFVDNGDSQIKNISLTVGKLNNLSIPTDINTKLESLRKDIPTYDSTKQLIKNEISKPFDIIKSRINSTNISYSVNMNFTVKNQNSLSQYHQCNKADIGKIFDDAHRGVYHLTVALVVVCAVAIIVGIGSNALCAKYQWEKFVRIATGHPFFPENATPTNPVEFNLARQSYAESNVIERWAVDRNLLSPASMWLLHYVTMQPLLDYLIVGLAGIIISLLELALVQTAVHSLRALKSLETSIVTDISKPFKQEFDLWRNQTNSEISNTESKVNTQLLGWVHDGSQTVNSTIANFISSIDGEISKAFNGTVLYQPLQAAVKCTIENKLEAVEKALTWVHDNSQVSLPRISNNLTAIFTNQTSTLSQNVATNAKMMIDSTIDSIYYSINLQLIISGVFIGVWVIFAIGAYVSMIRNIRNDGQKSFESYGGHLNTAAYTEYSHEKPCSFHAPVDCPFDTPIHDKNLEEKHEYQKEHNQQTQYMPYNVVVSSITPELPLDQAHSRSSTYLAESSTSHPPRPVLIRTRTPQSPVENLGSRITQYFNGPGRTVQYESLNSPQKGSIVMPDTPRTPLRAMIIH